MLKIGEIFTRNWAVNSHNKASNSDLRKLAALCAS